MPTELEELVGFIASPNPQIRALATENLIPYSISEPAVFKADDLQPIKNLKILLRDHPVRRPSIDWLHESVTDREQKIAEHAITILVNLTGEEAVLECLAKDDKFLDLIFERLVSKEEVNANLIAMLLANLAKWDGFKSALQRKQSAPTDLESDELVLNQLMDLFVKGQDGAYNKNADYDYLAYVFADLAKHAEIRHYFLKKQDYDGVIPISKLKVFTEHTSEIRRKGVASTIKNVAFEIPSHPALLSDEEINILPYVLLPITGSEEYDIDDSMAMLPDLQLLPPDKKRDPDSSIVQTHVETLMLLTTTKEGRELMREVKVYPIIRETHLKVDDEDVREACDRLVQVLMRDEEETNADGLADGDKVAEVVDEDEEIVEV